MVWCSVKAQGQLYLYLTTCLTATYSMVQDIIWKADCHSACQKNPAFLWNPWYSVIIFIISCCHHRSQLRRQRQFRRTDRFFVLCFHSTLRRILQNFNLFRRIRFGEGVVGLMSILCMGRVITEYLKTIELHHRQCMTTADFMSTIKKGKFISALTKHHAMKAYLGVEV
jgi:hypothetical protein